MKLDRELNIKGMILDKQQLERYLEKIASNHNITQNSNKNTFPINALKENFELITKTYRLLDEHINLKIPIHPAGEWLLDNYYIIEETVKTVSKELTLKKYRNLIGLENGPYQGYARIYVLASEIIAYTDNKIDAESLKDFLIAYQTKKYLSMEEIWSIQLFMQIAIIKNIREICEKIYASQIQKYKVESIIERLIEKNDKKNQKYNGTIKGSGNIGYKEMKYPFVEYMSYRLKKYGKQAYGYLQILEEETQKTGSSVEEIIKKEHFEIAMQKVLIENSIKSLKEILRMDFLEIFEKINGVEEILKQDPAQVYENMDYKTKIYYRNAIQEIAEKTKISETYIAKKSLELAKNATIQKKENKKQSHIGYYLIGDGRKELGYKLETKYNLMQNREEKAKGYILSNIIIPLILAILFGFISVIASKSIGTGVITAILIYIPITEIYMKLCNYILGKSIKPKLIPKMDFSSGVPEELASFIVVPTIVKKGERVQEIVKKLEVYYIANKSENLYFALLGDAAASQEENEEYDDEVIHSGFEAVQSLNKKYKKDDFPIFHFLYRKRKWNTSEKSYLGWERKRGLLNQFNEYLLGNQKNDFKFNTIQNWLDNNEENIIPKIKYIITLDADTILPVNSGLELIGAMAHILNKPIIDENKNIVIDGYGIMQPRVGIELEVSKKSLFTRIYAGLGGTDCYTNAISDVYQDNFGEGIFTGKGIYDLSTFSQVLKYAVPENTVLSHDLLEGCYLRCGLVSDILLLDGYPAKFNSFMTRTHRWIRGDWQIAKWLKRKIINKDGKIILNPLNYLSKFKILDNLRRSLLPISTFVLIFFLLGIKIVQNAPIGISMTVTIAGIIAPTLLDLINLIVFKEEIGKEYIVAGKSFAKGIHGIASSILIGILEIAFLAHKAYIYFNAISKTIYRMNISKQHMLEWMTAEEAEKQAKTDIVSYYKTMFTNTLAGIICLVLSSLFFTLLGKILLGALGFLFILGPGIAWYISKEINMVNPVEELSEQEKEYIKEVARRTWSFFKNYMNEENNYLPPDNYQEDRTMKIAQRTSPTNIGLGMLALISSYDLGEENLEYVLDRLEKIVSSIEKLQKWNGHLYNWYNTKTLEPLIPRYVSSVDSGNFVGYLYVVKQFLLELKGSKEEEINSLIQRIELLIVNTDFSYLYNPKNRLFSIGFNIEENKLTDSYYDLLASEARQTSLVAIAKKDVPVKHWNSLSRNLTSLNHYKGLISWSGTAFEYFMPNINIKRYEGSLLDESCKFMLMSQKEYAKKLGIPWGITEAAFNLKDLNLNYQYKAFGIPWIGLKRGLADEMVVAPYGSILALTDDPHAVIENIKLLEKQNMYDQYGFYESIDYTPSHLQYGEKYACVKTYMSHHQGLILLSINNLFNNNILQKRFFANPEIEAVDILLQERMPDKPVITKENKEKVEKLKYADYETYTERVYTKQNQYLPNANVISSENYTICMDEHGEGFSKYKDIFIHRYKPTADLPQGILFYIKNIKNKRIWSSGNIRTLTKADRYNVSFAPDVDKISRVDGSIETTTKTTIVPNEPMEIRRIELKNIGNQEEILEVTSFLEPILSKKEQDYAHPAFNNLFLTFEMIEDIMLIKRRPRGKDEKELYLGVKLLTENETIGELEYEINKEKFIGRANLNIPKMVKESKPLSKNLGLVTEPCVAMRKTIKIEPKGKVTLDLLLCVSSEKQEAINKLNEYSHYETISKTYEISKARTEAEIRYLDLKGKEIDIYQKIMTYLVFGNPMKKWTNGERIYSQAELWKYGISGDIPIVLVRIKEVNDAYVVEDLIKAYDFLRVKNIQMDLVILNEEENVYEQYVKEQIESIILNKHLAYLKNTKAGIFVLGASDVSKEDKQLLQFVSKLVFYEGNGDVKTQLEEMEEEYINSIKNIGEYANNNYRQEPVEDAGNDKLVELQYYNEFGGFSKDGREYKLKITKENKLPTVWSHAIGNENFGTIVTENMGGYTWSKNSRLNRLTSWNNIPSLDIPSEIFYIKDIKNGKAWSLGANVIPNETKYEVTYGFGYAIYEHKWDGILQEVQVFVPRKDKIKVNLIRLKNTEGTKKELKLIYYIKPVLEEDEIKSNGYLYVSKEGNLVLTKNLYRTNFKEEILYVGSSEEITSFTGNKDSFIGKGSISNPDCLSKVSLDKENGIAGNSCVAIEIKIELEAYENKEITVYFGSESNKLDAKNVAYKYAKIANSKEELANVKKFWYELLNTIKVKTPLESMNILLNGWAVYQTIVCRLWAKSGYYQSGGATGFRDQLQDTLGLKNISTEFMKNQIIKAASHQFIEGDVEHWWHEETKMGIRTRFSDDLLWLVYLTCEYIEATGDESFLDTIVEYRLGETLKEGEDEKYDVHVISKQKGSLFEHCIKALEKVELGENGLPKIGSGDWNDGFSTVGNQGKGTSVWLGFFLYAILEKWIPLCEKREGETAKKKWEEYKEKLKRVLNTVGWDGRWYKRAYTDEGDALGSIENEECRIDSISQSWATISGAGDNDKKYISLESLENHLVDKENGIIKLLDPPFDKGKIEPGYIKAYMPGVRENGGQYTHAAIWVILAETILGLGDKAIEYYRMITPVEHARTKDAAKKYKVEPYVLPGDVYGAGNLTGRGGWTWYTGSSSWYYKVGIENILGLKIEKGNLKIEPCIPKDWKEYSMRYRHKGTIYNIKVKNPNGKNIGISKMLINGKEAENKQIRLEENAGIKEIEVII